MWGQLLHWKTALLFSGLRYIRNKCMDFPQRWQSGRLGTTQIYGDVLCGHFCDGTLKNVVSLNLF